MWGGGGGGGRWAYFLSDESYFLRLSDLSLPLDRHFSVVRVYLPVLSFS